MSERSHVPGATATFGFAGRGVTIYGVRGLRGGYARIAIDGIARSSRVSFRAGLKRTHVPVFVANDLADVPYRVEITVIAQAPAGYVNVESADTRRWDRTLRNGLVRSGTSVAKERAPLNEERSSS